MENRKSIDNLHAKNKPVKFDLNTIEEQNMEYDIKEEEVDLRLRIYILILLMNVMLNFDTGVIPGALVQISEELNFNSEQMAYLGSLVYIGLSAATFFGSYMFHKFQAKWIISFMVFCNAAFCVIFAYSSNQVVLYCSRFVIGFTQAFVVIYAPVWINEFSPAEASSRWMAGFHSACVVGILSGYISSQIIVNYFSHVTTWRTAIYIQGILQFLLSIITVFVDNKSLDVKAKVNEENIPMITGTTKELNRQHSDNRIDTVDSDDFAHLVYQFKMLLTNYVFVFVTL